jgi:hypothetical protein
MPARNTHTNGGNFNSHRLLSDCTARTICTAEAITKAVLGTQGLLIESPKFNTAHTQLFPNPSCFTLILDRFFFALGSFVSCRDVISFLLLPSNQQTKSAPLVGCPRPLIRHIRSITYRDTDTVA